MDEQRVREIVREELARGMVTLTPTVRVSNEVDVDDVIQRIQASMEKELSQASPPFKQEGIGSDLGGSSIDSLVQQVVDRMGVELNASSLGKSEKAFLLAADSLRNVNDVMVGIKSYEIHQDTESGSVTVHFAVANPSGSCSTYAEFMKEVEIFVSAYGDSTKTESLL